MQQYGAVFVRLLFLADAGALYCSLYVALALVGIPWNQRYVTLALLSVVLFGLVTSLRQIYRSWRLARLRVELVEVAQSLTATAFLLLAILYAVTVWIEDRSQILLLALWFVLAFAGMAAARTLMRLALRSYRLGADDHRLVAFYGATNTAARLARTFQLHAWMGVDVVGFYDDRAAQDREGSLAAGVTPSGTLQDLMDLAHQGGVGAVYVALPLGGEQRLKAIVDAFADTTVSIFYCPALMDFNLLNAHWDDVIGQPVISLVTSPFDGYRRHLKRIEDLALALAILPVIALPLAVIAVAVKLTSPGPVLYLQTRHGLGGRPFKIRKFRTMFTVDGDAEFVQAKEGDARITPVGAFLRRTSLDELPQFFNVLAGEMSVVGPRPAPVRYNEDHRRVIYRYMVRHKVKPGITGLAQVSGSRGETQTVGKTEERTEFDLRYINDWSLWLDITILWKTVMMTVAEFRPR